MPTDNFFGEIVFLGGFIQKNSNEILICKMSYKKLLFLWARPKQKSDNNFLNINLVMQKMSLKIFFISLIRLNVWVRNLFV
jgi:hypothetical protein